MQMAKVFHSDGSGNARQTEPTIAPGWYFQIDGLDPSGPYATEDDARSVLCNGGYPAAVIAQTIDTKPVPAPGQPPSHVILEEIYRELADRPPTNNQG